MGSGAVFSIQYGQKDMERLRHSSFVSFLLIALVALVINVIVFVGMNRIICYYKYQRMLFPYMQNYLQVIFIGIGFTFLYNYFASLLRAGWGTLWYHWYFWQCPHC